MAVDLTELTIAFAEVWLSELGMKFDEATGQYYYDTILVKRSLEGASASGTCEDCEENAAAGWIDSEDVYPTGHDGPPFHPNCVCSEEYKEKRQRVYI